MNFPRDLALGFLMALSIALVPNILQVLVKDSTASDLASKLLLIGFLALGPTLAAPLIFGSSAPQNKGGRPGLGRLYLLALILVGVAASGYFLAVVGFGSKSLGAGVAELLDSSLVPIFYSLAAFLAGSALLTRRALWGILLCLGGLVLVAATTLKLPSHLESLTLESSWALVPLGVLAALCTALSIWIIRRLVRHHKTGLGLCVSFRYGGVALVFLAVGSSYGEWHVSAWHLSLAFLAGAILISLAFLAAVKIESELTPAAAMAATPLLAFGLEGLLATLGWSQSQVNLASPMLWAGALSTAAGIWLLQRSPATAVA